MVKVPIWAYYRMKIHVLQPEQDPPVYYSIVILTILYYLRVADLMGITSPYPRENIIAGIKEGRQSCYKTTCLVDYSYMFFCISSVRQTAISMGCNVGCPFIERPFDDNWGLEDPTGKSDEEFKKVIDEIRMQI